MTIRCPACGQIARPGAHRCTTTSGQRASLPAPARRLPSSPAAGPPNVAANRPPRAPLGSGAPPPPAATPRVIGSATPARVVSRPQCVTSRADPTRLLGPLGAALAALILLINPGLLVLFAWATLPLWLPLLLLVWLLGRLRLLGPLMLIGARRPRSAPSPVPTLTFRIADAGEFREVLLFGHDTGVREQDVVRVAGPRRRGVLHPVRVVNETTGAVLWRAGLARAATLLAVDLGLLLILVSLFVSRAAGGAGR